LPRGRLRRRVICWQNVAGLSSITRRDYELTMVRYHPDVRYEVDDRFQVLGLPAKLHGRKAIIAALYDWGEQWEQWELAPIALVELDDGLLGLGRFTARGRASGIGVDVEYAQLITLRAGMVIHEHDFVDWDQALRGAGLDPADFATLLHPPGVEPEESRARLARRDSTTQETAVSAGATDSH
jgi:ketosteroid isomerase-like protein